MEQHKITVMIVDDHPLMRRGIHQLLKLEPQFQVIAETSSGAEAVEEAHRLSPDLILLDLNMKGLSGLDTLKALRNRESASRILILTVSDARSDIYALVDAGADGYLLKDSEPEQLLEQIMSGARGQQVFSDVVHDYLANRAVNTDPFITLTERELDVLQEVAKGLSNKEVAGMLHISEETVKVHIRNLLRKLNVKSRVAATVLYLQDRHN
ncbi:transcriptional regulator NarP [[Pantoea] beijingensis]|uniref:Transcriptional regulator NarP n=1 Tax=[Pantoea] beijingensis TaxID=1324864 RepID=A0A443I9V5_9GAMM|nr:MULTISPECIES: response regulator [Erwiniaceae]RWR00833.1 transcriptional regulator NarP [[Pantoea] beijingensis]